MSTDKSDNKPRTPEEQARLKAFGLRIKVLRTMRRFSQEELADEAGFHRTFIGQVERGQRGMNIVGLWPLAKALNVSIGELFADEKGNQIP